MKNYDPNGYEAAYDPVGNVCTVTVKGLMLPDGRIIERGGVSHPDDKAVARFTLQAWDELPVPLCPCLKEVRETFEDTLLDKRDLLNAPIFRNSPRDDREKKIFAAAYDAAQTIRTNMTVLGVGKLIFSLSPSMFSVVDCFSRSNDSGEFWILACTTEPIETRSRISLMLTAYILEAGGYIPPNAKVRCGIWHLMPQGAQFNEIPNGRVFARNEVIKHLLTTPF